MILHGLWDDKERKARYVVIGTIIAVLGSMIRFSTVYLFGVFLVVAFILYAVKYYIEIRSDKSKSINFIDIIRPIFVRLAACLLLVGVLFGTEFLGSYIRNHNPKYSDFNEFQTIRSNITDVITPYYNYLENDYKKYGYDFNDYVMINSWQFVDRDIYTDDNLKEIASLQSGIVQESIHNVHYVVNVLFARSIPYYPVAFALYIVALLSVLFGKNRLYPLILVLSAFAMFAFFIYTGRTMYRVEWGVYFCSISCVMSLFDFNENSSFDNNKIKAFGKQFSVSFIFSLIIILYVSGIRISKVIPDPYYRNLNDQDYQALFDDTMSYSGEYLPEKLKLLSSFRTPHPALIERLENDDDYYYIDFPTAIQVFYYDYDPWIRPEQGLFRDSYAYFGSVVMHHPGEMDALAANGIDPNNPYSGLINENVLLVDNILMDNKLEYVRKYYLPDAEMVFVEEINGYKIWKIFDPSNFDPESLQTGT